MERKEIITKDATIKISLRANSGYSCDMKGKIGLDQWEQINTIIDSGSCLPNLHSELEKSNQLKADLEQRLKEAVELIKLGIGWAENQEGCSYFIDEATTFITNNEKK